MLGSALCKVYHGNNSVYALHRDKECYAACTKDYSFDLMDSIKLPEYFDQIKPDFVIHCAGLITLDLCEKAPLLAYETNVIATDNITRCCPKDTKLVYISTDQVYGGTKDHSETNTSLQPLNQYGKTKFQGELKAQEFSHSSIIVRTNIFGWNAKPGRISSAEWIYNSLKKSEEITLFTDYTFSPVYTECLGEIIMHLVDKDFTGVINAGSPTPCSKYDFGIQLAEEFHFDKSCIRKGSIAGYNFVAPRCNKLDLNISKLSYMGLTAPDYGESLKKFSQNEPY